MRIHDSMSIIIIGGGPDDGAAPAVVLRVIAIDAGPLKPGQEECFRPQRRVAVSPTKLIPYFS
jgi:hypothetical protein